MSDHLPSVCILHSIQCPRKAPVTIFSRDTRKKNLDNLMYELSRTDWNNVVQGDDVNTNMDSFHDYLQQCLNKHVPEREFVVKGENVRREKWVTPGLLKSIKHCKVMYKKTLHKNCEKEMKEEYKCYSTLLKKVKRSAKKLYYSKLCTDFKSNTKKLWKVINEVSGKTNDKSCLIDSLKIDNILECNGKMISNAFGKYFSSVGENLPKKYQAQRKG